MTEDDKITKMRLTHYKHSDFPDSLFRSKKEMERAVARLEEEREFHAKAAAPTTADFARISFPGSVPRG
jgi:hypothetical protein